MPNSPEDLRETIADFNADLDNFAADLVRIFKPKNPNLQKETNTMSANNTQPEGNKQSKGTEVKFKVSEDGKTENWTVNTNGGNFNHRVKGRVVQGDSYGTDED